MTVRLKRKRDHHYPHSTQTAAATFIEWGEKVLLNYSYWNDWGNHSNQVPEDHGAFCYFQDIRNGFISHVMAPKIAKILWSLNVMREWELCLNTNKTLSLGKTLRKRMGTLQIFLPMPF